MAHERSGEILYTGVPVDIWPQTLKGEGPSVEAARVGLENVADVLSTVVGSEKQFGQSVHAGPELMKQAMPSLIRSAAVLDKTISKVTGLQDISDANINSALRVKDGDLGREIRGHLKSLGGSKAHGEVLRAIEAGDLDTASAALHGPPSLSGLTHEQQKAMRDIAAMRFAPEHYYAREDAAAAVVKLQRAKSHLADFQHQAAKRWIPTSTAAKQLADLMKRKGEPNDT